MKQTDWDSYYLRPGKASSVTRDITENKLLDMFDRYGAVESPVICELGGANSCFFAGMRRHFPNSKYIIVDNNRYGLDLFSKNHSEEKNTVLIQEDVLNGSSSHISADIVYSVGLIEHFSPADTAKVIKRHFSYVKPGGLVVITFPTPTWLYSGTRGLAELFNIWNFPDERPLLVEDAKLEMMKYGELLTAFINWPIVLTQGVVAIKAQKTGDAADLVLTGNV